MPPRGKRQRKGGATAKPSKQAEESPKAKGSDEGAFRKQRSTRSNPINVLIVDTDDSRPRKKRVPKPAPDPKPAAKEDVEEEEKDAATETKRRQSRPRKQEVGTLQSTPAPKVSRKRVRPPTRPVESSREEDQRESDDSGNRSGDNAKVDSKGGEEGTGDGMKSRRRERTPEKATDPLQRLDDAKTTRKRKAPDDESEVAAADPVREAASKEDSSVDLESKSESDYEKDSAGKLVNTKPAVEVKTGTVEMDSGSKEKESQTVSKEDNHAELEEVQESVRVPEKTQDTNAASSSSSAPPVERPTDQQSDTLKPAGFMKAVKLSKSVPKTHPVGKTREDSQACSTQSLEVAGGAVSKQSLTTHADTSVKVSDGEAKESMPSRSPSSALLNGTKVNDSEESAIEALLGMPSRPSAPPPTSNVEEVIKTGDASTASNIPSEPRTEATRTVQTSVSESASSDKSTKKRMDFPEKDALVSKPTEKHDVNNVAAKTKISSGNEANQHESDNQKAEADNLATSSSQVEETKQDAEQAAASGRDFDTSTTTGVSKTIERAADLQSSKSAEAIKKQGAKREESTEKLLSNVTGEEAKLPCDEEQSGSAKVHKQVEPAHPPEEITDNRILKPMSDLSDDKMEIEPDTSSKRVATEDHPLKVPLTELEKATTNEPGKVTVNESEEVADMEIDNPDEKRDEESLRETQPSHNTQDMTELASKEKSDEQALKTTKEPRYDGHGSQIVTGAVRSTKEDDGGAVKSAHDATQDSKADERVNTSPLTKTQDHLLPTKKSAATDESLNKVENTVEQEAAYADARKESQRRHFLRKIVSVGSEDQYIDVQQNHVDDWREEAPTLLSIGKIKSALYAKGRRVHSARNFLTLFKKYWAFLRSYIHGHASRADSSVLGEFLTTASLKRLHNRLVKGLLQRSLVESIPARLSHSLSMPSQLRRKINVMKRLPHSKDPSGVTSSANEYTSPSPAMVEWNTNKSQRTQPQLGRSSAIPGALAIDPRVRSMVARSGLKVTENAVWLFVIAVREFTLQLIRKSIASASLFAEASASGKDKTPSAKTIIRCTDVLALSTDERPSDIGCIGGASSRLCYEDGLANCYTNDTFAQSPTFKSLKSFVVSTLAQSIPKNTLQKLPTIPPTSMPATSLPTTTVAANKDDGNRSKTAPHPRASVSSKSNSSESRRSPFGGLGRGAKDLAALKARSSVNMKNRQSVGAADSVLAAARIVQEEQQIVSSESQTIAQTVEVPSSTPVNARKGKGFGVKNLAAMKARSSVVVKGDEPATRNVQVDVLPSKDAATQDSTTPETKVGETIRSQAAETSQLVAVATQDPKLEKPAETKQAAQVNAKDEDSSKAAVVAQQPQETIEAETIKPAYENGNTNDDASKKAPVAQQPSPTSQHLKGNTESNSNDQTTEDSKSNVDANTEQVPASSSLQSGTKQENELTPPSKQTNDYK